MTIMSWVRTWVGRYIDEDGAYGNQCWDLIKKYCREIVGCPNFPTRLGGAGTVLDSFNNFLAPLPQYFDKVKNDPKNPNQVPLPGAIIFWSYTHAAIVLECKPGSMTVKVFQQNAPVGAPPVISEMSLNNCAGWFEPKTRPTFDGEPVQPQPAPAAKMPDGEFYHIKPGDTFWDLENTWGLPTGTLQSFNAAQNPRELRIGQPIRIRRAPDPTPAPTPAPVPNEFYRIQPGDTFWDLENTWGLPHGTLQNLNPGLNPRELQIGHDIRVKAAPAPAAAPEAPAVPQVQQVTDSALGSPAPAAAPAESQPEPAPQPDPTPALTPAPVVVKHPDVKKHRLMIDVLAGGGIVGSIGAFLLNNPDLIEGVIAAVSSAILFINRVIPFLQKLGK